MKNSKSLSLYQLIKNEYAKNLNRVLIENEIPIGIISWNGGWSTAVIYEEYDRREDGYENDFARIDYSLPYKEAIKLADLGKDPERIVDEAIDNEIARRTANAFSSLGLRHESVVWFCHNWSGKSEEGFNFSSFGKFGFDPVRDTYGEFQSKKDLERSFRSYVFEKLLDSDEVIRFKEIQKRAENIARIKQEIYRSAGEYFNIHYSDDRVIISRTLSQNRWNLTRKDLVRGYNLGKGRRLMFSETLDQCKLVENGVSVSNIPVEFNKHHYISFIGSFEGEEISSLPEGCEQLHEVSATDGYHEVHKSPDGVYYVATGCGGNCNCHNRGEDYVHETTIYKVDSWTGGAAVPPCPARFELDSENEN